MRQVLIAVLLCAGGVAWAGEATTEEPWFPPEPAIPCTPRQQVCYRTAGPLQLDGRLTEKSWQGAPWTSDFVDIRGGECPAPPHRTRARFLWDDTHLYVGAHLEEPHVWATLTERDSIIFQDNDLEVFIDPDGDSHLYFELEVNALGTEWDLLLVRPYRDGGPAVHAWDIPGLRTAVHVDGTRNDAGDQDQGWSVEIAFPWGGLAEAAGRPCPPRPGDQWRMNLSRVEWHVEVEEGRYVKRTDPETGKPLPEENWVWSPQGLVNMHYPEMWGVVQFSGLVAVEGEEEIRADPTAAARWALRLLYYRQRAHQARHGAFTPDLEALGLSQLDAGPYRWPPALTVGKLQLEAVLEDGEGEVLRLTQDGRLW